jgi:autotransporter-associated beta strand protein
MKPRSNPFLAISLALISSTTLQAGILYWDGTDTTAAVPDANGGAGAWDTTLTNWNTTATAGSAVAWPSTSTLDDDAFFGAAGGAVTIDAGGITANQITFDVADYSLSGGALTLDGSSPGIVANGNATIGSIINGAAGLVKSGAATLTLSAANNYAGTTSIGGGTVALTGGANRLATGGSVGFSADGTLDLGGNSQTLANLSISTAAASTKGTITNGALTLDGASALIITPSVTTGGRTAEIDASGLTSLTLSKSGQAITVGGFAGGTTPGNFGIFKLSAATNSITASAINIGTTGAANAAGVLNKGEMELGTLDTLNANTWTLGTTRDGGIVRFKTGLVSPAVTLRGQDTTSAVTTIIVGQNGAGGTTVGTSSFDLSAGSVDLKVTDLVLSRGFSASATANTPAVNGSFSMGGGTVEAANIYLSKNDAGGRNNTNTSLLSQLAGDVKVSNLIFGTTTYGSTAGPAINAQYTIASGTLRAGDIRAGSGVFASGTRRINFDGGTITHYDAASDLGINGVTGTGGTIGLALGTAGTPTIEVATGRTVTLGGFTSISGTGSLLKTGPGQLVMNNPANTAVGTFRPSEGSVVVGATNALAGQLVLLDPADTGTLSFTGTTAIALGGLDGSRNLSVLNNLSAIQDLALGNANSGTYTGIISGAKSIRKVGAGTQTYDPGSSHSASLSGLNVSGGTLELKSGNYTVTGSAATSAPASITGFVVATGGTFRMDGANVTATSGTYLFTAGNTGGGNSNFILDSGTFDANGREVLNAYGAAGTTTINGGLFICNGFKVTQNTGILNLNGGTLRLNRLYGDGNTSTINFNGGTLQARVDRNDFIDTTITNALVQAGGAVIDSNSVNIIIPEALLEDSGSTGGGLTKLGAGSLTLTGANTYTGATSVTAGTLALVGGSQKSPITVDSGSALGFTLGSPTTSTSSVTFSGATAKVTVTGTPIAATLMTASSITGAPVLDPAIPGFELAIEGSGTLLNLVATSGGPFDAWATMTNGLSGGDAAATADPDSDGLDNAVEFVIGGQPNPANPNANSSALAPTISTDANNLIFTFRRTDLALTQPGIGIAAEYGSDLAGWTSATDGVGGVAIVVTNDIETGVDQVQVSIPKTLASGEKMFARLNVVIP